MSARILVVDDIEANRRLLQAKLEAQYHVVLLARSGREGLAIARAEAPDIILLDVMMPGLDGFETCRQLKADPVTAHIPVVMVTALSGVQDRVRGLEAGAEDFLTKPVDDFALASRIEALSRYNMVASELRQRQASGGSQDMGEDRDAWALNGPARVFILDEGVRQSNSLAATLRQVGHTVTTLAETGSAADLAHRGVDIILLNLSGQSFDALKICAHFRMNAATRAISIIAMADTHDRRRAAKALKLGASDVLITPADPQELLARVRTQARRARYIDLMRRKVDRGLELSVIDQLTGLYNRRYMGQQLAQWMKRAAMGGKPVSVVALDIDHFKQINDTWGHHAGDGVLRQLAQRLQKSVRPMDVVCRPGGEEFLVILPETPGDLACTAAERLRRAVASQPFEVEDVPVSLDITVSAGVSCIQGDGDTADDLLRRADVALYAAKSDGRNRVRSQAA